MVRRIYSLILKVTSCGTLENEEIHSLKYEGKFINIRTSDPVVSRLAVLLPAHPHPWMMCLVSLFRLVDLHHSVYLAAVDQ